VAHQFAQIDRQRLSHAGGKRHEGRVDGVRWATPSSGSAAAVDSTPASFLYGIAEARSSVWLVATARRGPRELQIVKLLLIIYLLAKEWRFSRTRKAALL
jgi:hypothetical protein